VTTVAELKRVVDIASRGESDVTAHDIADEWALPRLSIAEDAWIIEIESGKPVSYGFVWMTNPPGRLNAELTIHPDHRGRGLGGALLELCEQRAAQESAEVISARSTEEPVSLAVSVHAGDAGRAALLGRRGYRHARTFLRLGIDLRAPVTEPVWPSGVRVRTFRRHRDEAAVHAAMDEAFRDQWRPWAMNFEEWLAFRFRRPDLDTDLWWLAWDHDEIAGALQAIETPLGGYIDDLAVRRPWRRRGLGRALLLQAFVELRRRRQPRAYLDVDSASPTGAPHLYRSVGMHSMSEAREVFEKDLRQVR
jgi:ribosomal protein S18 acetylase RimI-like enzyme